MCRPLPPTVLAPAASPDPDRVVLRYADGTPMMTARQYEAACAEAERRLDARYAALVAHQKASVRDDAGVLVLVFVLLVLLAAAALLCTPR